MDGRQEDVHERAARERRVYNTQDAAEQPAGLVDGHEDRPVGEREDLAVQEVENVADRTRPASARGERGSEQQRDVHPGQPGDLGEAEARCQDDGPDETAGQRTDQCHRRLPACSRENAALTSAKWTSAWGKLPSCSAVEGSISSAKRPTSLASGASSSIRSAASSTRPTRARAATSQKEQVVNAPSSPGTPSSPR